MVKFLLCVLQYLLIMVFLGVIGFIGGKIGIGMAKKKNAEVVIEDTTEGDE